MIVVEIQARGAKLYECMQIALELVTHPCVAAIKTTRGTVDSQTHVAHTASDFQGQRRGTNRECLHKVNLALSSQAKSQLSFIRYTRPMPPLIRASFNPEGLQLSWPDSDIKVFEVAPHR